MGFFSFDFKKACFLLGRARISYDAPFANNVVLNNIDIFDLPDFGFARELNNVFGEDGMHCAIPEELLSLVDFIGDKEDKSRGTVANDNFIYGVYHIGGLTVFNADGGGIVGARSVTGVHLATPVTVSRHSARRAVQNSVLLEWAERQKKLLDTVEQSHHKMAEALLSLYDLGLGLGDRYFLLDIKTQIVFFSSMNFNEGDAIFICCQRHPFVNKVELGQMQNIFTFCDHKHKQLSDRFTYVLQFNSSMHGGYGLVELFGKDYSTEPKTAFGQPRRSSTARARSAEIPRACGGDRELHRPKRRRE